MIVSPAVEDYMRTLAARYDEPVLLEMEAYAAEHGFPIVERLCGVVLEQQARAIGARRIFELGSGYGYSAYWFSRAIGPQGELHLTDGDAGNRAKAEDFLTRAGVWDRITYHVGDALTSFGSVDGEFDIVYCDVDKEGYPDCWRAARTRVRIGGLYICDNTLWRGEITEPTDDERGSAIREHNELVSADEGFVTSIVPTRDGLLIALRVS